MPQDAGGRLIAKGAAVASLAGFAAYCLRAAGQMGAYHPAAPVLTGVGVFLAVAALIGFVVFFRRGRT